MMDQPAWFAVQAKPGAESVAARNVATLDVPTFLPLACEHRSRGGLRSRSVRPLFPGYFFARFQAGLHWRGVCYSRGVLRVVGAKDAPWPVEDSIIEEIQARLDADGLVKLKQRELNPGDPVRICDGPLQGWTGVFESTMSGAGRVAILLNAIRPARILIDSQALELADAV